MNRSRKGSPRTFKMEPTGPKVPSRYLTGPTGSCHDNCKCEIKPTTETKPKHSSPKRVPNPPTYRTHLHSPNSFPRINKPPPVIPKSTTRGFKNNSVVKDHTLKKDATDEPKKRDDKLKSTNSQTKTYNRPSSRSPRRRLSDLCVPSKDTSLPASRWPKRRLSEIIIPPNRDVAYVSNGSTDRGSTINKNESRKDSKLPLLNKKSNSIKATVSTSKNNAKVSPLRTYKSFPKPEIKGSRKSKPMKLIEEHVHEETLHANEPNNDAEITKSQSQKSPDCSPSSSEVKTMKDDQNEVVESSKPSLKDEQNEVVKSSPLEDNQNEVVEPLPPSIEYDTLAKDGQPSRSEVEAMKDDQNEVVESSPLLLEVDALANDGQHNDNVDLKVNDTQKMTSDKNLVVETNDIDDARFRRGTIVSPESESNNLVELQFKKGKELENETEEGEKITLKRLSSDGVVYIYESQKINIDLKHQEMEEKKDAVLVNNVIKETASRLIQTRKSKVKALVGAFETIVSGEPETSYTSRSRSFGSKKVKEGIAMFQRN